MKQEQTERFMPPAHCTHRSVRADLRLCLLGVLVTCVTLPQEVEAKRKESTRTQELLNEIERLKRENLALHQSLDEKTKISHAETPASNRIAVVAASAPATAAGQGNPFEAKAFPKSSASGTRVTMSQMSCGSAMKGKDMAPDDSSNFYGQGRFTMNPVFGDVDMFWNMPEDTFMFSAKWFHNQQGGLQNGTTPFPSLQANAKYMMPPTSMAMDMIMFMPMWGVTDDLTLMAMINYGYMGMAQNMSMGSREYPMAPMNVGGIQDTNFNIIYRLAESFVGTLQVNVPTGSTQQMYNPSAMTPENCNRTVRVGCYNNLVPYGMQLGAGVVGLMPAVTYNWFSQDEEWNLGGTVSGTAWMGTSNGWSPGNSIKLSIWSQKTFGPFAAWLRSNYVNQSQIAGCSGNISGNCINPNGAGGTGYIMPGFDPRNTGGEVATLLLGGSYSYKMFSIGLEGGVPYYQNFNGIQNMNSYQINSGIAFMW